MQRVLFNCRKFFFEDISTNHRQKYHLIFIAYCSFSSSCRRYIRATIYIKGITLRVKNKMYQLFNNWNHRQWRINEIFKLLHREELACSNEKVESTFFCYSWDFLLVNSNQNYIITFTITTLIKVDGRHGGRNNVKKRKQV